MDYKPSFFRKYHTWYLDPFQASGVRFIKGLIFVRVAQGHITFLRFYTVNGALKSYLQRQSFLVYTLRFDYIGPLKKLFSAHISLKLR